MHYMGKSKMGYKVLLETLSPKLLDGSHIIRNSSTMIYEKGFIYVPLPSRSFGESVSKSTLYTIFFHHPKLLDASRSFGESVSKSIYTHFHFS